MISNTVKSKIFYSNIIQHLATLLATFWGLETLPTAFIQNAVEQRVSTTIQIAYSTVGIVGLSLVLAQPSFASPKTSFCQAQLMNKSDQPGQRKPLY